MSDQLFRTRYFAPIGMDGVSGTPVELTDSNCIFVFSGSSFGSDSNAGTRTSPYATLTKAISMFSGTKRYCLHRGKSIENIATV